ncbi:MAG: response regulator [Oscillospiraceae bacterium]|nr:response regulator [Oscillospiraceae bacterium]
MEKKNKLLIIDDDTTTLMELIGILKQDYMISTAKNGLSALENLEKTHPDLIILDIIMPGLSGFEVMARLNQLDHAKDIPVILISGAIDIDDERKGLTLGAIDYIRKPFDEIIIKQRVDYHIGIINQLREKDEIIKELK